MQWHFFEHLCIACTPSLSEPWTFQHIPYYFYTALQLLILSRSWSHQRVVFAMRSWSITFATWNLRLLQSRGTYGHFHSVGYMVRSWLPWLYERLQVTFAIRNLAAEFVASALWDLSRFCYKNLGRCLHYKTFVDSAMWDISCLSWSLLLYWIFAVAVGCFF